MITTRCLLIALIASGLGTACKSESKKDTSSEAKPSTVEAKPTAVEAKASAEAPAAAAAPAAQPINTGERPVGSLDDAQRAIESQFKQVVEQLTLKQGECPKLAAAVTAINQEWKPVQEQVVGFVKAHADSKAPVETAIKEWRHLLDQNVEHSSGCKDDKDVVAAVAGTLPAL